MAKRRLIAGVDRAPKPQRGSQARRRVAARFARGGAAALSGVAGYNQGGGAMLPPIPADLFGKYDPSRKFVSANKAVVAFVARAATKQCMETANCIGVNAKQTILSHIGAPGLALGSGENERYLAESCYIATQKGGAAAYEQAKGASQAAKSSKRRKWAPPVDVQTDGPDSFTAVVAFAYEGAGPMHDGYFDPRANKQMQGTPFLMDAVRKCEDAFFKGMAHAVEGTQTVAVKSIGEVLQGRQDREEARIEAANRNARAALFDDFLASVPDEEFAQRKARVSSAGRSYRGETVTERDERILQLYHDWIRGGGMQGMS